MGGSAGRGRSGGTGSVWTSEHSETFQWPFDKVIECVRGDVWGRRRHQAVMDRAENNWNSGTSERSEGESIILCFLFSASQKERSPLPRAILSGIGIGYYCFPPNLNRMWQRSAPPESRPVALSSGQAFDTNSQWYLGVDGFLLSL